MNQSAFLSHQLIVLYYFHRHDQCFYENFPERKRERKRKKSVVLPTDVNLIFHCAYQVLFREPEQSSTEPGLLVFQHATSRCLRQAVAAAAPAKSYNMNEKGISNKIQVLHLGLHPAAWCTWRTA